MANKVFNIVGVAAAGLIGYNFFLKNTAAKNLRVGDIKYQKLAWKGLSGTLHLVMPVTNITRGTLRFDGFNGTIYYKVKDETGKWVNKDILPAVIPTKTIIAARQTTMIPIEIDLSVLSLGSSFLEMLKSGRWLKNAYIKGNIIAGALQIKIDNKIY